MRKLIDLGVMLIDIGIDSSVSNEIHFDGLGQKWKQGVRSIGVSGPGSLTGTARVQVSDSMEDLDEFGTTWKDLQEGGADVVIPEDGFVSFDYAGWRRMRVSSNGTEVEDRRFKVSGVEE